jgi:uncharacterized membrane protein
MSPSHWHPLIVHLPLGLWSTVPCLYTAAYLARSDARSALFASVATLNLVLGSIAAAFALMSGLLAATSLPLVGIAQDTLTRHVAWAVLTTLVFIAVTLLRAVGRPFSARPGSVLLVVAWLSALSMIATGYYGGTNVYRYGLGVDLDVATERATHRPAILRVPRPTSP